MNWEEKYMHTRVRLREAMMNQIQVRCKDCMLCSVVPGEKPKLICDILFECDGSSFEVEPNDFCAWGEKE